MFKKIKDRMNILRKGIDYIKKVSNWTSRHRKISDIKIHWMELTVENINELEI